MSWSDCRLGVSSAAVIQPPQLTPPQTHRQMKAKRRNLDLSNSVPRQAANVKWLDPNLKDWPEEDYRIFVGDLGNEVNDDMLGKAFSMFKSFNKARVNQALKHHFFNCVFSLGCAL